MGRPLKPTGHKVRQYATEADTALAILQTEIVNFMKQYSTDPAEYHKFMWNWVADLRAVHLDIKEIVEIAERAARANGDNGE